MNGSWSVDIILCLYLKYSLASLSAAQGWFRDLEGPKFLGGAQHAINTARYT
ncbi:hypothetical protein M2444_001818 [Paenibacillus sp. PastF-3]|jgi:hypothetical protein|nr:hypothetical protein [Paenibacillus sp. PastF-3]